MATNITANVELNIRELMLHLGTENFSELARILGVTKHTVANWKKRNTYDVAKIESAIPDINRLWLLTGEGPMLKSKAGNSVSGNSGPVAQVAGDSLVEGSITTTANNYAGASDQALSNMGKALDMIISQQGAMGELRQRLSDSALPLPSVDGRLVADDTESYAEAVAKYGGQLVPEYNAEFRGGDHGATLHSSDLVGHWIIPNAPKGSFIVTMVGRSMEPQIASGSKLLLAPMRFDPRMPLSIPFGQLFGVVVRDSEEVEADGTFSAHIKILRRHKDKALERSVWIASSVNDEQFDDFEIPVSRVTHLYKVLTSINALWGY